MYMYMYCMLTFLLTFSHVALDQEHLEKREQQLQVYLYVYMYM